MDKNFLNTRAIPLMLIVAVALVLAGMTSASEFKEDSSDASSYLNQAKDAAARDDHLNAIRLYKQAILSDSSLKREVALELGHQYTWADMPDSAVQWYEFFLKAHPGDMEASLGLARALSWADRLEESERLYRTLLERGEDQSEVRLGLARVVSWNDRLVEAEEIYSAVLRDDLQNHEALLGMAQVKNWSGRHKEALRLYSSLIEKDPGDEDAIRGAAAAENWVGFPFKALERLKTSGTNGETSKMEKEIEESLAPRGELDFASSKDSDDIKVRKLSTAFEAHSKKLDLSGNYGIARISQQAYPDIRRNTASVTLAKRFTPSFAVNVSSGYERNRFEYHDLPANSDWKTGLDLFIVDGYVTFTPIDWFRLDAGFSRNSLEIPLSIFKGVIVSGVNVGIDRRFTHSVTMFLSSKFHDFSDSNRKFSLNHRLQWESPWDFPIGFKNRLTFTPGYEYFHFTRILANGYYNPRDYLNLFLDTSWSGDIKKWLSFFVKGRLSMERENNNENSLIGAIEGNIDVKPWERISILTGYHNSRSRLDSPTGYRYTGFYLNLVSRF